MKFLIAHESQLSQARIRRAVSAIHPKAQFLNVASLTDAYHLSEHQEPNFIIISETFANAEECELLVSLIGILKIPCIVLTQHARASVSRSFLDGMPHASEETLADMIRQYGDRMAPAPQLSDPQKIRPTQKADFDPERLILIGASTGGIDALLTIVRHFDQACPPVMIVQHTGGAFAKSLIRLLNGASNASVQAATDGTALSAGHIYLAPCDKFHLQLAPHRQPHLQLQSGGLVSGHRPSIDALFQSALPMARQVTAALLTGMGKDGAAGLTQLRAAGAVTIGQDRETSVVYGMPRVALEMGGVEQQLPLEEIAPALLKSCQKKVKV